MDTAYGKLNDRITTVERTLQQQGAAMAENTAAIARLTRAISIWNVLFLCTSGGLLAVLGAYKPLIHLFTGN